MRAPKVFLLEKVDWCSMLPLASIVVVVFVMVKQFLTLLAEASIRERYSMSNWENVHFVCIFKSGHCRLIVSTSSFYITFGK